MKYFKHNVIQFVYIVTNTPPPPIIFFSHLYFYAHVSSIYVTGSARQDYAQPGNGDYAELFLATRKILCGAGETGFTCAVWIAC